MGKTVESGEVPMDKKVALVTGACKGLGLAIATKLVAQGFRVALTGRNLDEATRAADSLGKGAKGFLLDVTSEESIADCLQEVERAFEFACGRAGQQRRQPLRQG